MRQDVDMGIRKWIDISRYQILEKQGGTEKNNLWPETFEDLEQAIGFPREMLCLECWGA